MATTYDNASLVMIPSGVKEDKLYSIKPTDGSGDFTFSRGSDIQATRVNASGLIEKAKINLLLQSNTFSTTWINSTSTETGGQAGYDGTNNAWLLETTGANGRLNQNVTAGVCTLSIYAKSGTLDYIRFQIVGPSDANAYFDLSTGAIGTTGADVIDATITSVGGGWYRCTMSTSSSSTIRIFPAQADNDTSGTSGNILIQDAQLNHGLIAQDYVETTTTAVVEGLTADLPRLDYSGGASCPSLLLEPSRTNLFIQSEYFGASWTTANGMSVTSNDSTSPEGLDNATKLSSSADNGKLSQAISLSATTTYSVSFYAKNVVSSNARIIVYDATNLVTLVDDLFSSDLTTDWKRIDYSFTTTSAANILIEIRLNENEEIKFYGAQIEAGSYPTSYIPTYGTAANRGADVCNKTSVSSLIGTTESSIFFDVVFDGLSNNNGAIFPFLLESGSGGERASIVFNGNKSLAVTLRDNSSDVALVSSSASYLVEGTRYKIGVSYSLSGLNVYVNGSLLGTDSVPSLPTLENIYINDFQTTALYQGALDVKQVLLFKTALTNAELAALTTI